jgi:hypothetical protein
LGAIKFQALETVDSYLAKISGGGAYFNSLFKMEAFSSATGEIDL